MFSPVFLPSRGFSRSTNDAENTKNVVIKSLKCLSYEEKGLYVPHMKLIEAGKRNETLFAILMGNVREPMQVRGDLLGLVSCNEVATRRLAAMLDEFGLKELDTLGEYIVSTSRDSMRAAVRKLPRGTWHAAMTLDGYESPIELKAALTER